jgi:hypothetical protein
MKRAVIAGMAALSLASSLSCTENGRSVVLVDVSAPGVAGIARVMVHVTGPGGEPVAHVEGGTPPLKLGIYLPKTFSGPVSVLSCSFTGTNELIDATNGPVPFGDVQPGGTYGPRDLVIIPGTPPDVCGGTGGRGGGGGGGAGGASGSGGASGGTAGTGGSVGGLGGTGGGAAGTGGAGGVAGTGGRGGGGGTAGAGGGTAGTGGSVGGRGGTGGTGGAAGTGGSAGSAGGRAGTGGGAGSAPDWRGPTAVSASTSATERLPSVAVDPNGNAVVVFESGTNIHFSRYDVATGWSTPAELAAGSYGSPLVAVDAMGRYTAVWSASTGAATTGIWHSTSPNGSTWSAPMPLHPQGTYVFKPVLAMNSQGKAIVAWTERMGSNLFQVVTIVRDVTSWSPPLVMRTGDDANDRWPAVAVTSSGEVFVVWEQRDTTVGVNSIWWRGANAANSWTAAALFESFDAGAAQAPAIAVNGGNAIVTYLQRQGANVHELWARRNAGANWATALKVGEATNIDTTQPPSVTLDASGTATVAWGADMSNRYNVHVNRALQSDTAWPAPTAMETDNQASDVAGLGRATLPVVRSDAAGNVILVWRKLATGGARYDLFARRFSAGSWGAQTPLETIDAVNGATASVFAPALSVNGAAAVAAWNYGGTGVSLDVYANVFR